mmetsp:Transcript_22287/g.47000  ORF Transcript_22287/g.47000 Transcript_22287/m.47000 type:complete len:203 (+) Transcript_22287:1197-1805(+)
MGSAPAGSVTSEGSDGPCTSASSRPTRAPLLARAHARLSATVDLPTPPLQLLTATSAPTLLSDAGACLPMNDGGVASLRRISLPVAHGMLSIASAAALRSASPFKAPERRMSVQVTRPSALTVRSLTIASCSLTARRMISINSPSSAARARGEDNVERKVIRFTSLLGSNRQDACTRGGLARKVDIIALNLLCGFRQATNAT